ncbi:KUP/HAK/KT family potassium transporter [Companilactobacillus mishanensis]|uniref:Probable potassium transport system protein Kup n=1 Tax=Companilactobacillus mishanensis TaxID=2486008 RepID=A0A5P0ZK85_9LACO|nr:KUP/HAK/KT family potassium transporter [Companilactobacillus mishanensis]MQS53097.1 potassium transporter Kup [Companilactobacillus mishanensis]
MAIKKISSFSKLGMLITLGIVYGDIGTSPLYVMNAIIHDAGKMQQAVPEYIIGSISLIFWTLMLITTIKYIGIAMKADNHSEGGIFALYALVRSKKWLVIPALIGGSALLADGTLTPAVTVTSAMEGLKGQTIGGFVLPNNQSIIIILVTVILLTIFIIQKFGTENIGKSFGPIMLIWFSFIGIAGFINITHDWWIFKALSPIYAVKILTSPVNHVGIFILGSVFLATTGAEALYSDMGQVGKYNIYATWPFVCTMLMLNYLGQGAWVINHYLDPQYFNVGNINPFYEMLPGNMKFAAIIIATFAAIIASQALITGSFTLVEEAIGLKMLPRLRVRFPGKIKSQLYIGTVNWALCLVTLGIVWSFQTSEHMEAAYGLAITLTMLMTTILLHQFLIMKKHPLLANIFVSFFFTLETLFLVSSLTKFIHGGYVTIIITTLILMIMVIWYFGNKRRDYHSNESQSVSLLDYLPQFQKLSSDKDVPMFATNLVFISRVGNNYSIKRSIIYSILDQEPKRAKVYWFITVNQTDKPYECNYTVDMMHTRNVVDVQLNVGFKKSQHVNIYIRQIVNAMLDDKVIDPQTPEYSVMPNRRVGSFKFVILNEQFQDLGAQEELASWDRFLIGGRLLLQNLTLPPALWYGLEFSDVTEEKVPLFLVNHTDPYLVKEKVRNEAESGQEKERDSIELKEKVKTETKEKVLND